MSLIECDVLYHLRKEIQMCVSYRQPAADVSDEQEGIVFEVAHHGVAAAQLCGPTVPLVVVADAAISHHGQYEREDPLVVKGETKMHFHMDFHCIVPCKLRRWLLQFIKTNFRTILKYMLL